MMPIVARLMASSVETSQGFVHLPESLPQSKRLKRLETKGDIATVTRNVKIHLPYAIPPTSYLSRNATPYFNSRGTLSRFQWPWHVKSQIIFGGPLRTPDLLDYITKDLFCESCGRCHRIFTSKPLKKSSRLEANPYMEE